MMIKALRKQYYIFRKWSVLLTGVEAYLET